jgi:putative transposase
VHSWAFAQLGSFIAYKARKAGVPVVHVDPAYTSPHLRRMRPP